jgi:hypothetical protein
MKKKLIGRAFGFDVYFDGQSYTTNCFPGSSFSTMGDLKGAMRIQAFQNLIAECNEKN